VHALNSEQHFILVQLKHGESSPAAAQSPAPPLPPAPVPPEPLALPPDILEEIVPPSPSFAEDEDDEPHAQATSSEKPMANARRMVSDPTYEGCPFPALRSRGAVDVPEREGCARAGNSGSTPCLMRARVRNLGRLSTRSNIESESALVGEE
jgi:hypothetical protein